MGTGGPLNNYGALGLDEWSPRERAKRLEEQAAILGPLLRGHPVDFEGRHCQTQNPTLPMSVQ
jgi:alkanesulfonate monooxygenase SsuD/methylene tetrahydromethanopterin reductase-like flavin-dependent oxidoreductase (luciferase family)